MGTDKNSKDEDLQGTEAGATEAAKTEPNTEEKKPFTLNPPFAPGDIAFFIDDVSRTIQEDCTGCNGLKKIELHDKSVHDCPKCKGRGQVSCTRQEYFVKCPGMVYGMDIKARLDNNFFSITYDVTLADGIDEKDKKFKSGEGIDFTSNVQSRSKRVNVNPFFLCRSFKEAEDKAIALTKAEDDNRAKKQKEEEEKKRKEAEEKLRKEELLSSMR